MAIKIECDSCKHILNNDEDQVGAEPEAHYTLSLVGTKGDKTIRPLTMDLCPRCAKKYIKVLQDPV